MYVVIPGEEEKDRRGRGEEGSGNTYSADRKAHVPMSTLSKQGLRNKRPHESSEGTYPMLQRNISISIEDDFERVPPFNSCLGLSYGR